MRVATHRGLDALLTLIRADGLAPPPGVIVIRSTIKDPVREALIQHEQVHQDQIKRMGYLHFLGVYLWQFLRYGYGKMPLEVEAKEAQRDYMRRGLCIE